MQNIRSKRKKYEPLIYDQLKSELAKLLIEIPHLNPDRHLWDIEGDWSVTGTMHFLDQTHMPRFAQYADFDCRTIKIVNFAKPALRMTFFKKHRYWLLKDKDLPIMEKQAKIKEYINQMIVKAQIMGNKAGHFRDAQLSQAKGDMAHRYSEANTWNEILNNLDQYEIAISNYQREHYYTYINYKFRLDETQLDNEQVHLLNPQRDRMGNITQVRHNIVFVDTTEIFREHPYQNKEIDGFLNRFTMKTELGRHQIYARIKPHAGSIEAFEQKKTDPAPKVIVTQSVGKQPKKRDDSSPTPLFPEWDEMEDVDV
jgi:hypothetical protein